MICYSLNAHAFDAFPYQVAALRRCLQPKKIVCVQGPFGHPPCDSAVRLAPDQAESLGVELLEVPALPQRGTIGRQPLIYQWLLKQIAAPSIILHGDMFPTRPMTMNDLLQGKSFAGRGHWREGKIYVEYTWLAATRPIDYEPPYWRDAEFTVYGGTRSGLYEDCAPGWWHADKISYWPHLGDTDQRLAEVRRRFGPASPLVPERVAPLPTPRPALPARRSPLPIASVAAPRSPLPDPYAHLAGEDLRRYLICRDCPQLRVPAVHAEVSCETIDDNRTSFQNCDGARHRRWRARLASPRPTCPRWHPPSAGLLPRSPLDLDPCPICTLADPLAGPENTRGDWQQTAEARDRHAAALHQVAALDLPAPPGLAGDGVLFCGEGRYWPGIVIAVRLLRKMGCRLPVQVWRHGPIGHELDQVDGVTLVDVAAFRRRHPARILRGWEVKMYAILHSGFKRLLYLDSDAYCVNDPTPLFSLLDAAPFVFWMDLEGCRHNVRWEWYGDPAAFRLPPAALEPIQGGQLLIDLSRFWRETMIAHWINMHADYFYRHQFGDQDGWKVAWRVTGANCRSLGHADWEHIAFNCRYQKVPYVVHRCRSKLYPETSPPRWDGLPREAEVFAMFQAWNTRKLAPVDVTQFVGEESRRARAAHARATRLRGERQQLLAIG